MSFQDAFIIRKQVVVPQEKGAAVAAQAAPAPSSQGVFLSAQALVSFPVACAVVGLLWKLVQHYWPGTSDFVVLYISLVIGFVIFIITITDPSARPKGLGWLGSILIAILNSLVLAASALGLVKNVLGS
jgi:hypothetical protein